MLSAYLPSKMLQEDTKTIDEAMKGWKSRARQQQLIFHGDETFLFNYVGWSHPVSKILRREL